MQGLRSIEEWDRDSQRHETDPERRLRTTKIPAPLLEMDWDGYDDAQAVTDGDETLKFVYQSWSSWLVSQIAVGALLEGLVVLGPPGRGKSQGAALGAKDVCLAGGWVKWTTYDGLVEAQKNIIRLSQIANATGDYDQVTRMEYRLDFVTKQCDLLVLDDVGKEYRAKSGFSDTGLDRILRDRVSAGKATLLTSNLTLPEWGRDNESMTSFLREVGEVTTITGGRDRRASRGARWRS